jgi:LEA14-like dessication related protein
MPRSPEYRFVEKVDIQFVGTQQLAIQTDVIYFNPNNFAIDIRRLDGELTINGHHMADVSLHDVQRAGPVDDFKLPLVFKVAYDKFAGSVVRSLPDLLRLQTIDLEIKGKIYVDRWSMLPVPFNYTDRYAVRIIFEGMRPKDIYLERI